MNYPIIIQSSFPKSFDCSKACETLIDLKLAACIQQSPPIISYYKWQGSIAKDEEYLLLIKTFSNNFDAIKDHILKIHPYELPEIISTKIDHSSKEYLDWLTTSVAN